MTPEERRDAVDGTLRNEVAALTGLGEDGLLAALGVPAEPVREAGARVSVGPWIEGVSDTARCVLLRHEEGGCTILRAWIDCADGSRADAEKLMRLDILDVSAAEARWLAGRLARS